jgi:ubiquinone/menaquinone biosynthesis C-methylase UbiE
MAQARNPFDDASEEYDAWFESPKGRIIFAEEVACLRRLMPVTTGRWLEVGTGTGRFAMTLGVKDGVDPSAPMLAVAARRGIRAVQAAGEWLPYADQCFNGVLMATTLCFLSDPVRTLQECHRVLRDVGRLVLGLIPADSPWGQLYLQKGREGHPMYSTATFYVCNEVIRLATGAGFDLYGAFSGLLMPPDSPERADPAEPRMGIVKDAGFVAIAFGRRPLREPLGGTAT